MTPKQHLTPGGEIIYPESDGKPMAENTRQYEWIVTIKENLEEMLPDAFVAADLFWYPVRGDANIVTAPDVMVAFGRPKGHRGSYRQWEEEGIAPFAVFEVLSPSNTPMEMNRKRAYYRRHGVVEYYEIEPESEEVAIWTRAGDFFHEVDDVTTFASQRLGIRFDRLDGRLIVRRADGTPFQSFQERKAEIEAERAAKEAEQAAKEAERAAKEAALEEVERLRAELRALRGETPES
jgi:Uma2 family endonuclease